LFFIIGTRLLMMALTPKSERTLCPTISRRKVRKTEAASAFWNRTKFSTGPTRFGVSKERLSEAVRNVGHSAADVERELKKSA
jgi:Protein of unknown function (DUF3606)